MEYTAENLGKKDPQYGGVLTDINTLPPGTRFYVHNGCWDGRIVVDHEGQKRVEHEMGSEAITGPHILAVSHVFSPQENIIVDIAITLNDGTSLKGIVPVSIDMTKDYGIRDEQKYNAIEAYVQKHIKDAAGWTELACMQMPPKEESKR